MRRESVRMIVSDAIKNWGKIVLSNGEEYSPYDFEVHFLKELAEFPDDPGWEYDPVKQTIYNRGVACAWIEPE